MVTDLMDWLEPREKFMVRIRITYEFVIYELFYLLLIFFLQNGRWFENIFDRFWHVAEAWGKFRKFAPWQGRASEAVGRGEVYMRRV